MKKKTSAFLLALALILTLSACGGSSSATASEKVSEQTSNSAESSSSPSVQADTAASITETQSVETVSLPLTNENVVFTYFESFAPPLTPYMSGWNENIVFQQLNKTTGVTINYVSANAEEAATNFQLMIASGDFTDLIGGFSNYYSNMDEAINQDIILNLAELISKDAPNIQKLIDADDSVRKAFTTDAGNVPLIRMVNKGLGDASFGAVIRQDWLDTSDLSEPVTYDDWYNILCEFKNQGHSNALMLPTNGTPSYDFLVGGYGVSGTLATVPFTTVPFYQVDGKVKFGLLEPEYESYLTMVSKWYSEGLVYTDFYSESGMNPSDDLIFNGEIGLWFSDVSNFSYYGTNGAKTNNDFKLSAATDPVQKEGDEIHLSENYDSTGSGTAISTKCSDPDLAMTYYNYLFSDEGSKLCQYGIEGTTYNVDTDGTIKYTELITNNPDGMAPRMALMKYAATAATVYHADPYATELVYTADETAAAKKYNTNRDADYRISGAVTLTAEESETYTSKMADITTFCQESIVKFITGETSIDKFDDFVTQLKSMGIQECIDIKQAAYDRYLKR